MKCNILQTVPSASHCVIDHKDTYVCTHVNNIDCLQIQFETVKIKKHQFRGTRIIFYHLNDINYTNSFQNNILVTICTVRKPI